MPRRRGRDARGSARQRRHHFVSDVPVGVFLSGGMDSTAIVAPGALPQQAACARYSMTFPGAPRRGSAEAAARRHFGTDITNGHSMHARPSSSRASGAADQPSIDGFNTYTVSRLASRHGAKVVLSGLGGDELFGGYPSFREVPRLARMGAGAARAGIPPAGGTRAAQRSRRSRQSSRRIDDASAEAGGAYQAFRGIFTRREALALTERYVGES